MGEGGDGRKVEGIHCNYYNQSQYAKQWAKPFPRRRPIQVQQLLKAANHYQQVALISKLQNIVPNHLVLQFCPPFFDHRVLHILCEDDEQGNNCIVKHHRDEAASINDEVRRHIS